MDINIAKIFCEDFESVIEEIDSTVEENVREEDEMVVSFWCNYIKKRLFFKQDLQHALLIDFSSKTVIFLLQ